MMDELESSRQKEVNSKIDDQVAPDGKDDVVNGKEEGPSSSKGHEQCGYENESNHGFYGPSIRGLREGGFIHRDLHNQFQAECKVQLAEGDAEGALGYLSAKLDADPLFFFKYNVDKDNRLDKIFWADGRSRMDYAAFGDVLVFDTTYRTNQYKKPFVILAGMSNHFMTIIFGCALFPNEIMETYMWVLEMLMEAMDGQRPISVVTDGDRAMRQAIERVIPNCRHRLCSWHLEKNALTNVHIPEFTNDFAQLMLKKCKIIEFDNAWARMVKQYKLENNSWVLEIHRKRDKWAEAYLRGHMFVGMRSTQRVEGMNAYFNMFLEQKVRLYEFVAQYDRALARMRVNEAETESKTENSFPVLTTPLRSLEKHAAELFTRKSFSLFRREISTDGKLFVMERVELEDHRTYRFGEYKAPTSTWTVEYFPANITIKCCCLKFESFGIPCCHMVAVMKSEQLMCIPPSCVLKRWTRRARSGYQQPSLTQISSPLKQTARFGILSSCFSEMSYYASHADNDFEEAREMAF
ncbi:hypothetical protein ACSBR1_003232 [Camellia fascicularis]